VAAYTLAQAGQAVVLLEANDKPGGWLRSEAHEGPEGTSYLLEAGPNSVPASATAWLALAQQLKLNIIATHPSAKHRFIALGTQLLEVPSTPWQALTSPILSPLQKLRVLAEPWAAAPSYKTAVAPTTDKTAAAYTGEAEEESLAHFVRRRLGAGVASRLVQPFVNGVYAGDVEALSASAIFPSLLAAEQASGSLLCHAFKAATRKKAPQAATKPSYPRGTLLNVKGGMATMAYELAWRLPAGALRLGTPVTGLTPTAQGTWQLALGANYPPIEASAVIMATSALGAGALLQAHLPAAANALLNVPYAPITVVYQAFKKSHCGRLPHGVPKGFGVLRCNEVPNPHSEAWLGTLWSSSLFPGRFPADEVVVSHFFGGVHHGEVQLWSPERAQQEALLQSAWQLRLPPNVAPCFSHTYAFTKAIPQYTLGHGGRIATAQRALQQWQATQGAPVVLAGNYLAGINLNQCVLSGQAAAARVLAALTNEG
jgi:oxygen-dependent protoporphyrinogen oxidase